MEVALFCKWILEVTASPSLLLYITCHIVQSWYNVGRDYKRYENQEVGTIGGYHELATTGIFTPVWLFNTLPAPSLSKCFLHLSCSNMTLRDPEHIFWKGSICWLNAFCVPDATVCIMEDLETILLSSRPLWYSGEDRTHTRVFIILFMANYRNGTQSQLRQKWGCPERPVKLKEEQGCGHN